MKSVSLLAAALLIAGAANAQTPTNQFTNVPRQPQAPAAQSGPNIAPVTAVPGHFDPSYTGYSQDSYIEQTGTSNYSKVDQTDGRTGNLAIGSGSSAVVSQTGSKNNAYQNQTLDAGSNAVAGRNLLRSTQAGTSSQSNQTQTGGSFNTAEVNQFAPSDQNRAIQTQTNGRNNGAVINQATASYIGAPTTNHNTAKQTQEGGSGNSIRIDQQGRNSYAEQNQTMAYDNDAFIGQGAPGANNTAIQNQAGSANKARIVQSVGGQFANNNYALQNQKGMGDQALIDQESAGNFARQDQAGMGPYEVQNNNSKISQSNVSSAAYTLQTGNMNTATVVQH